MVTFVHYFPYDTARLIRLDLCLECSLVDDLRLQLHKQRAEIEGLTFSYRDNKEGFIFLDEGLHKRGVIFADGKARFGVIEEKKR